MVGCRGDVGVVSVWEIVGEVCWRNVFTRMGVVMMVVEGAERWGVKTMGGIERGVRKAHVHMRIMVPRRVNG